MARIIILITGLVFLCTSAVYAKSTSDGLNSGTKKSKSSIGLSNKSSTTKSGLVQPSSIKGSKSQTKPKTNKINVSGSAKKSTTDPTSGKSGTKIR